MEGVGGSTDGEDDVWWYACTLCYRAFTDINGLRGHKRTVHGSAKDTTNILILSQGADLEPKVKLSRGSIKLSTNADDSSKSKLRNAHGSRRHRSQIRRPDLQSAPEVRRNATRSCVNIPLPAVKLKRCDEDGGDCPKTDWTKSDPSLRTSDDHQELNHGHGSPGPAENNHDDMDDLLTVAPKPTNRHRQCCHLCDLKTYSTRFLLRRHLDLDHNVRQLERTIKCPSCPKMFTANRSLWRHQVNVHGGAISKLRNNFRQRAGAHDIRATDSNSNLPQEETLQVNKQETRAPTLDIVIKDEPPDLHAQRLPASPSSWLPDDAAADWDPETETEALIKAEVEVEEEDNAEAEDEDPSYSPVQGEELDSDADYGEDIEDADTDTTPNRKAKGKNHSRHTCHVCSKTYALLRGLLRHLRRAHNSDLLPAATAPDLELVKCPICQMLCISKTGLKQHHDLIHVKGKFSAKGPPKVKAKKKQVGETTDPVMCPVCGKMLKNEATLKYHDYCVHSDVRPYKCEFEQCGATFKYCVSFKRHAAKHTEGNPFLCSKCPSTFKTAVQLQYHLKWAHEGARFSCRVCGLRFPGKITLRSHEFEVHDFQRGQVRYKCRFCDRQFSEQANLRRHEPRHTGERKFKCEFPGCGKTYKIITHLKDHAVRHLPYEELKHVCEVCGRRFGLAPQLRDHKRKIHGEVIPKKPRPKVPMISVSTAEAPASVTETEHGGGSF